MTQGGPTSEVAPLALPPIPGERLDPPVPDISGTQRMLDDRLVAAGLVFRTVHRYLQARTPLLTAGTTYYLFLSLISLAAFGYGIMALAGADQLSSWLTDALHNAFPGLIGVEDITAESVREYGSVASGVGLLLLGLAGTSSVMAANHSLHTIYGAPKDPRNYFVNKVRMFALLLVLGPLILLSFIPSVLITTLTQPVAQRLGIEGVGSRTLFVVASTAVAIAVSYLVIYLILARLGGIRPPTGPLRIGAITGALVMEVLKYLTASIVAWSLGKPQYGAFAAPITLLLVLYLQASTLYLSACLTAAIALQQADTPGSVTPGTSPSEASAETGTRTADAAAAPQAEPSDAEREPAGSDDGAPGR